MAVLHIQEDIHSYAEGLSVELPMWASCDWSILDSERNALVLYYILIRRRAGRCVDNRFATPQRISMLTVGNLKFAPHCGLG